MRTARHKTVQRKNKKPYGGIERLRDMLELVERRLAQVDVVRDLLKDTYGEPESITIRWHGKEEIIEHPCVWIAVYDEVEEAGDLTTRELLRRRFCDEPYWKTCDALYLSTSMYYDKIREILCYALVLAVGNGIVDPRTVNEQEKWQW